MKTKLLTICLFLVSSQVYAAGAVIKYLPDIYNSISDLFIFIFRGGRAVQGINENSPVAENFYNGMIFNDYNIASILTYIILLCFTVNYIPTSLSNHKKRKDIGGESFYSEFFLKNLQECLVQYNYFKVISFFIIANIWLSMVIQCGPDNPEPILSNGEFWFIWVLGIIFLIIFNQIIKCKSYSREIYTILFIYWMISVPIINIFTVFYVLLFYLMYFSPMKNLYEKGIKIKFN